MALSLWTGATAAILGKERVSTEEEEDEDLSEEEEEEEEMDLDIDVGYTLPSGKISCMWTLWYSSCDIVLKMLQQIF